MGQKQGIYKPYCARNYGYGKFGYGYFCYIYIDREQQYVFRRQFVLERETRETIEQKLKQIEQLEIPYEESEITQKRKRLTN